MESENPPNLAEYPLTPRQFAEKQLTVLDNFLGQRFSQSSLQLEQLLQTSASLQSNRQIYGIFFGEFLGIFYHRMAFEVIIVIEIL